MKKIISFLFVITPFFILAQTTPLLSELKTKAEAAIRSEKYADAIALLEQNKTQLKNDTTYDELFDDLGEIYFMYNDWNKILNLYEGHRFQKDEDSTLLTLAHFFHSAPKQVIAQNFPQELSYKPSSTGTPIIEVVVNGVPYHFWFDTGAGMSVVTASVAEKIKLKRTLSHDAMAMAATGKRIDIGYGLIDSLRIGNMNVSSLPCLVLSDKQLEFRILGIRFLKVDGIIGWNLLQELAVTINYPENKLMLAASSGAPASGNNLFWMNVPLVTCTDSAGKPMLFTFDSGGDVSALYSPYKLKADTSHAVKKNITIGSAGGMKKISTLKFPRVVLLAGGQKIVMRNVQVDPSLGEDSFAPDGVLGSATLKKYIVHFDLHGGVFELKN